MDKPTDAQKKSKRAMMLLVKTVRWQCSGCDHLCALLVDETIKPDEIVKCPHAKDEWRKVSLL